MPGLHEGSPAPEAASALKIDAVDVRLQPDDVTELVVNRPGEFAIERLGGWEWHDAPELTDASPRPLAIAAAAVNAQDVTAEMPICSTVLPSGERCQIVLPPAAEHVSLTLRKPSAVTFGMAEFVKAGLFEAVSLSHEALKAEDAELIARHDGGDWPGFFAAAVKARKNILISGATGSGRTTFAKGLIRLIPEHERLITIEDARELVVPQGRHHNSMLIHVTRLRAVQRRVVEQVQETMDVSG